MGVLSSSSLIPSESCVELRVSFSRTATPGSDFAYAMSLAQFAKRVRSPSASLALALSAATPPLGSKVKTIWRMV